MWLTPNYLDIALNHSKRGNVYSFEVPLSVIRQTEAGQIHRVWDASETFVPEHLWHKVRFLGKKMSATDLLREVQQAEKYGSLAPVHKAYPPGKSATTGVFSERRTRDWDDKATT